MDKGRLEMSGENETIYFEKKGKAGWIYLSRPERMNAFSPQMMRAVWAQLARAEADPEIRVLVFTGRGEAFCAGMDMAGLEKANPLAARRRSREVGMLTRRIADFSLPTVAAVNGVAMGVGLEVCLACDLVVASQAARFAFPEARLGMIPCGGGTQRLARLIGLRRAREMVFTGRILDAELACAWGLINEVVTAEELLPAVEEMTERLAMGGRMALYQAKRCVNNSLEMELGRGLEYEAECFTTCFASGEPAAALRRYAGTDAEAAEPEPEREPDKTAPPGESAKADYAPAEAEEEPERAEEAAPQEEDEEEDIFE